jgi:hypothetical protein
MPRRIWLAVLLAPVAILALGMQLAALTGLFGSIQAALGVRGRDSADVLHGAAVVQRAAGILEGTWSSPAGAVLAVNPLALGAVDDIRAATRALSAAASTLTPLAQLGTAVLGFDGAPPMVSGTTIDLARLPQLAAPVTELHEGLDRTHAALGEVPGSGPLGRPIGAIAESLDGTVADLAALAGAAEVAMPDLPRALGAEAPQRYLVCALNDAESFASGGAPLSAMVVEVVGGTIAVPISGQLESKLSPNNPPIEWEHAGGPPWYREGKRYPFVNSNFHPDFRTAAVDMERAWAALGYPAVQGVITIDVTALATILSWAGPVESDGYGRVDAGNLVRRVLVDAYRQFDSPEGVLERHARNDALTTALVDHLTQPMNLLPAIRGTMDAIPPRHIQAAFAAPGLQAAVAEVAAQGALSDRPGDLVGVYSQSGPNKLTVFQERAISQEVRLTADGGADIVRTTTFANAVPAGLAGDPSTYRGYLALRARMRVAYRLPTTATDMQISTGESVSLVPVGRTGPFPDDRGGQVLWQGHETAPGDVTTVTMRYRLPAGTFAPGTYRVDADPQPLPQPVDLRIRVVPAPGTDLPSTPGWAAHDGTLEWSGLLDRPLQLAVG